MNLNCRKCSRRHYEPLMLPCLHSFCSNCLDSWQRQVGPQPMSCPTCRRPVRLPDTGILGLPINALLSYLIQARDTVESTGRKSSTCAFCKRGTPDYFCFDCCVYACLRCKGTHVRRSDAVEHVVIESRKVSDVGNVKHVMSQRQLRCTNHPHETLSSYCRSCSKTICKDCKVEHKQHRWYEAEMVAPSLRSSLEMLLKETEDLLHQTKAAYSRLDSDLSNTLGMQIDSHAQILQDQIDKHFSEMVKLLNSKRKELLQEVLRLKDATKKQFKEQLTLSTNWLHTMEYTQNLMKQVYEEPNKWVVLEMEGHIRHAFNTLKKEQVVMTSFEHRQDTEALVADHLKISFIPEKSLTAPSLMEENSKTATNFSNMMGKLSRWDIHDPDEDVLLPNLDSADNC